MSRLSKNILGAAVLILGTAVAAPVHAQFASPTGDRGPMNETFAGNYKDPQQRSAEALTKGLRYKQKADKETDAKKKAKLLEKAKEQFQASNALQSNPDALLALGLIQIELGNRQAAADACSQALAFNPNNQNAKDCVQTAQTPAAADTHQAANGGGSQ